MKYSQFVPNTLAKLFQNSSSMGKYDPYNIGKVSEISSDVLSKGLAGSIKDVCGGLLSQYLAYLRFQNKNMGWRIL